MAVNASTGEEENKSLLVAISEKALWKKRELEPEVEKLGGMGTQKGSKTDVRVRGKRSKDGVGEEAQESLSEQGGNVGKSVLVCESVSSQRSERIDLEGRGGELAASPTPSTGCSTSLGL